MEIVCTIIPDARGVERFPHIFRAGMEFVAEHPEFIVLYLNISSAGMERFADILSREVEQQFAQLLKRLLTRDSRAGIVRADLDVPFAAHMINSLYIMFLSSLVSRHHQIRLQEYLEFEIRSDRDAMQQLLGRSMDSLKTFIAPNGRKE